MLGLSMDSDEARLKQFLSEKQVAWPHARIGQAFREAADYAVDGAPTYFLIGPDRKIVLNSESDSGELDSVSKACSAAETATPTNNHPIPQFPACAQTLCVVSTLGCLRVRQATSTSDFRVVR
jgi:hypothetical protein